MGSVCTGVMVSHRSMGQGQSVMKHMQCNSLPEINAQLQGGGVCLPNMNTLINLLLLHKRPTMPSLGSQ